MGSSSLWLVWVMLKKDHFRVFTLTKTSHVPSEIKLCLLAVNCSISSCIYQDATVNKVCFVGYLLKRIVFSSFTLAQTRHDQPRIKGDETSQRSFIDVYPLKGSFLIVMNDINYDSLKFGFDAQRDFKSK